MMVLQHTFIIVKGQPKALQIEKIDFLIINHVTKKPVIAIETDGYSFHNAKTEQYKRDMKKNHILEIYGLPLLRLGTNESGEKRKIIDVLSNILNQAAFTNGG